MPLDWERRRRRRIQTREVDRRRNGEFTSSPESEVEYENESSVWWSFEERKSFVLETIVSISANKLKGIRNYALRSMTRPIITN